MGVKKLEKNVEWIDRKPIDAEAAHNSTREQAKFYEQSYTRMTEFAFAEKKHHHLISPKEINGKQNPLPQYKRIDNAFSTDFSKFKAEELAALTVNDSQWHKEVRSDTYYKEQIARVFRRNANEEIEADLHADKVDAFFAEEKRKAFVQQNENKIEHRIELDKSTLAAIKDTSKFQTERLAEFDEQKFMQFLYLFLKEMTPTKKSHQKRAYEAYMFPTISEEFVAKDQLITPYEVLIILFEQAMPEIKRERVEEELQKYLMIINQRRLDVVNYDLWLETMSKKVNMAFVNQSLAVMEERRIEKDRNAKDFESKAFHLEKFQESLTRELLEFDRINEARKTVFFAHLEHGYKTSDAYFEREQNVGEQLKELGYQRDLRSYKNVTVEASKDIAKKDPLLFETQLRVIKQWVDLVELADFRTEENFGLDQSLVSMEVKDKSSESNLHLISKDVKETREVLDYLRFRKMSSEASKEDISESLAGLSMVNAGAMDSNITMQTFRNTKLAASEAGEGNMPKVSIIPYSKSKPKV